jgi:tRNA pseudouridine55 synthase
MELEKEYLFKQRFGISTDTYDSEGKIIKEIDNFKLERAELERVIKKYTGEILQIPPMYSAIKVKGKPLHELARKGIEIERKPKKVFIHSIHIEEFEPPIVTMRVICSKGTYIRSLCNDIGQEVGTGACVVELTRTRIGEFKIENSISLEEINSLSPEGLKTHQSILSIDKALYFLPSLTLQESLIQRFQNGNSLKISSGVFLTGWVKLRDKTGKIIGIGHSNGIIIKPERIIWEEEE